MIGFDKQVIDAELESASREIIEMGAAPAVERYINAQIVAHQKKLGSTQDENLIALKNTVLSLEQLKKWLKRSE